MKIQLIIGMIASGKGTYSSLAAIQGIICVNDDAIVNLIHYNNYTMYDKKLKLLYKSIENHIIAQSLALGRTVLVDRGLNISVEGRKRYLALAASFDVQIEALVLDCETPEIHAQRRFDSDCRGYDYKYWLKVAQHHASIYKSPTFEEGFSEVHHITFKDILNGKIV